MFYFMNFVRSFVNYAFFHELCDWMRFEVDCAKSHHCIISEGLALSWLQCSCMLWVGIQFNEHGFISRFYLQVISLQLA